MGDCVTEDIEAERLQGRVECSIGAAPSWRANKTFVGRPYTFSHSVPVLPALTCSYLLLLAFICEPNVQFQCKPSRRASTAKVAQFDTLFI